MSIGFVGTPVNVNGSTSDAAVNFDMPVAENPALFAFVCLNNISSAPTATYDGVGMTPIGSIHGGHTGDSDRLYLTAFYQLNPNVGDNEFSSKINPSRIQTAVIFACENVHQATPYSFDTSSGTEPTSDSISSDFSIVE